MSSVLVGMFDDQAAATRARSALMSAGFADDAVTMTGGSGMASSSMSSGAAGGDLRQGETGGTHAEGGIARFFEHMFGSDDETPQSERAGQTGNYEEAFKRGSYGVSVSTADDAETDRAEDILNEAGAFDIDEQAESWRREGSMGGASPVMGTTRMASTLDDGATRKLQEVEERLNVGKRTVSKGGVRIFSRMTEVPVSETVRLREEHANVQRTAVDRPATEADFAAFKEGSIEVREMNEEAVVSKTARVTGEVEIGKTSTEREEVVRDTVRQTHIAVEKLDDVEAVGTEPGGGTKGDKL